MASSSRPEDPVAAAAKVIRIIHDNHTAAGSYLHSLKVTTGANRVETKTILQCMDLDEYTDLLEDLDTSQKLSFFDKVAGMNERSYASQLNKETAKKYFEALSLKSMGLSFKDVRAELKKIVHPVSTPAAPSTPVRAQPVAPPAPIAPSVSVAPSTPVASSEPQTAVPKAAPATQKAGTAPNPQKEKETKKEKKDKKRKREEELPKTKTTLPDVKSTGSDPASKKQKTDPAQKAVEPPVDGLSGAQRKRQKRREKKKVILGKVAAGEVTALVREPEAPAAPLIGGSVQADEDVHMESPEPAPVAATIEETAVSDSTAQANPKSKRVRRSKHKSEKAKSKPTEHESEPLPGSLAESEKGPASLQPPATEIAEPESAEVADGNKKARGRRARKAKAAEAAETPVTAELASPHESTPAEVESTPAAEPVPVAEAASAVDSTAVPESSHAEDETSGDDDDESVEGSSIKGDTMSSFIRRTTLPALGKPTMSAKADQEPTPEVAQEHSSEESPSPTTRETSVSSTKEVASPPPQQQEIVEDKKSSPVSTKKELPKPVSASFTSAPVQHLQRPQLSNSFGKPQSSFTSTRSISFQSASNKKSANDSFAEFAAFASGKKSGYDSSDDDDDESSSSSSESEDEKPALVQVRKPSPIRHIPYQAPPVSSSSQAEPSAMNVDTKPEISEQKDPASPVAPTKAIDVVMTNDEQDAISPVQYHDSQPSAQDEEETVAGQAQNDNPITFQSFHESTSPKDAPQRSPLPEIPDPEDLMESGGYQPASPEKNDQATPAAEEEQTSEPANRENHEGPQLTDSSHSIELGTQSENDNDIQELDDHLKADEQERSSEDEQASVAAQESNNLEGRIAQVEGSQATGPEASGSDSETEEPAEAFSTSMDDFLAAWEEETDNFEERIEQLRQLLVEDGDGSTEDNKDMLEKLMNEVVREEKIYKSKTAAASNAVTALPQLAREQIQEVIDRADASFEQRVMMVRSSLREEYNAESARGQLSPSRELGDVEMENAPQTKAEQTTGDHISDGDDQDVKVEPSEKSSSPAPSSLGWAPSEDEGITESATKEPKSKARKSRKSTGATSEHFTPSPKRKRVPAGVSAVAFPKLTAPRFGLIQEKLANDPFRLLIAVTFLNKTAGRAAVPIFEQVMEKYPTPTDLAAADVSDLSEMIHSLGFQNQRARKLVKIAETWIEQPPQKGKLFRTKDYPNKGNGCHLKPKETVDEDVDDCVEAGALEIAHIYGSGPYAWDSWRIFCRDKFRGVAEGYNGEGVPGYNPSSQAKSQSDFEPEWKRVVPLDKELRACLRWMWLREGWEWDPLTGKKKKAAPTLMREASEGVATWDEPVAMNPHDENAKAIEEELEGSEGPDALVPGLKVEDTTTTTTTTTTPPPKRPTRRSRNTRAAKKEATPPPPPPPVAKVEQAAATPIVPAGSKRLNTDPEIMTSRLRPRAGRTDALTPAAAVPATPSRRRARK